VHHMNLLLFFFLVRVLAPTTCECQEEQEPYEDNNEAVMEQRFVYKEYSPEESWDMAFDWAWDAMKKGKCRKVFKEATGREPREFAASGEYVLHFDKDWKYPAYACYTTCDPPWISCDYKLAYDFSPSYAGVSLLHELAHAANCTNWWKLYSPDEEGLTPLEESEILSAAVEAACE